MGKFNNLLKVQELVSGRADFTQESKFSPKFRVPLKLTSFPGKNDPSHVLGKHTRSRLLLKAERAQWCKPFLLFKPGVFLACLAVLSASCLCPVDGWTQPSGKDEGHPVLGSRDTPSPPTPPPTFPFPEAIPVIYTSQRAVPGLIRSNLGQFGFLNSLNQQPRNEHRHPSMSRLAGHTREPVLRWQ